MDRFLVGYGLFWTMISLYMVIVRSIAEYKLRTKTTKCTNCSSMNVLVQDSATHIRDMLGHQKELINAVEALSNENTVLREKVNCLAGISSNTTVN